PVRIGVNWGSLDADLLTRLMDENSARAEPLTAQQVTRNAVALSALGSARRAEELGLAHDRIILSAKVSGVQDLIAIYRDLAGRCDYPLHLGLTEAGMGSKGIVASTAGMAVLLQEGIGDTIRVSLTPDPGGERAQVTHERARRTQLQALRGRHRAADAHPGTAAARATLRRLGPGRRRTRPTARVRLPGLLPHHELREPAGAHRQHRGPPPGPRGRLQLLPRQLHHARHRRAVGERLRVRREGGSHTVELEPSRDELDERAHLRRDEARARIHRVDALLYARPAGQHVAQLTTAHVGACDRCRQQADARSLLAGGEQHE